MTALVLMFSLLGCTTPDLDDPLVDPDPFRQAEAIRQMSKYQAWHHFELLEKWAMVGRIGDVWTSPRWFVLRPEGLRVMAYSEHPDAIERIAYYLDYPLVRRQAIDALAGMRNPDACVAIVEAWNRGGHAWHELEVERFQRFWSGSSYCRRMATGKGVTPTSLPPPRRYQ